MKLSYQFHSISLLLSSENTFQKKNANTMHPSLASVTRSFVHLIFLISHVAKKAENMTE